MTKYHLVFALSYCILGQRVSVAQMGKPTAPYVAACGRGKLALYWTKVSGAKAYYIYRRTKSTRDNFQRPTAKLSRASDSFGGSPMKLWVDRKLVTGREYFYVVKAVDSKGHLSGASPEESEFVDPDATPWDSCDAKKIVDAVYKVTATSVAIERHMHFPRSTDEIAVTGPDGMDYVRYKGKYIKHKPNPDPSFAVPFD